MSAPAKRLFLAFALFASFTCALWIVITLYVVIVGARPHIGFLLPILALAGAAAVGFRFYYDERRGAPTFGDKPDSGSAQNCDERLLTTPLRTGVAVGLTALAVIFAIRDALRPSLGQGSLAPFSFMLHGAALIAVNIAFWGYLGWLAFCFIRGTRERERVVMIGWAISIFLTPLEGVRPEWNLPMRCGGVLALFIALLAAFSLWLRPLPHREPTDSGQ